MSSATATVHSSLVRLPVKVFESFVPQLFSGGLTFGWKVAANDLLCSFQRHPATISKCFDRFDRAEILVYDESVSNLIGGFTIVEGASNLPNGIQTHLSKEVHRTLVGLIGSLI